jgi:hypothetical protein
MIKLEVDEAARLQVLNSLELMNTSRDPSFDRIASMAKLVSGSAFTAVSLIDSDR